MCARLAVVLLTSALLAGCNLFAPAPEKPPVAVVAPTGPATSAQIIALEEQLATSKSLLQRASGAVWGAQDANVHNPAGLPKAAVEAQLLEAAAALPEPSAEDKLEKANQNARILAGQLEQVKAEMGQKISENEALRASLDAKAKELISLTAAAEKERAEAAKKLQEQFDVFTKKIIAADAAAQKAADDARNQVMRDQVAWLNRAAAACGALLILVVGLASVFGGIGALRSVAPFAALLFIATLTCAGLAQVIGAWWFKWAILGSTLLSLGVAGWWAYAKHRQGVLKEAAEAKAAKLQGVAKNVIPVLDRAYEEATQDVKELLDRTIFQPLSAQMDKAEKAAVHEIRATTP